MDFKSSKYIKRKYVCVAKQMIAKYESRENEQEIMLDYKVSTIKNVYGFQSNSLLNFYRKLKK